MFTVTTMSAVVEDRGHSLCMRVSCMLYRCNIDFRRCWSSTLYRLPRQIKALRLAVCLRALAT